MWNFDAIKQLRKFEEENKKALEAMAFRIADLSTMVANLSDLAKNTTPQNLSDLKARLEELEIWKSKIHLMLTAQTPTGKETLSPMAKALKKRY